MPQYRLFLRRWLCVVATITVPITGTASCGRPIRTERFCARTPLDQVEFSVIDRLGSPVPGADLLIGSLDTAKKWDLVTDNRGHAGLTLLPGRYHIWAT
jgi:hypothetical protein